MSKKRKNNKRIKETKGKELEDKIANIVAWAFWTIFCSFILPLSLSIVNYVTHTASFFDGMDINYLSIIFSQAAGLFWTFINYRNLKSEGKRRLFLVLMVIMLIIMPIVCAIFFSPFAVNSFAGSTTSIFRKWILIVLSLFYLFVMISNARYEWKSYTSTH